MKSEDPEKTSLARPKKSKASISSSGMDNSNSPVNKQRDSASPNSAVVCSPSPTGAASTSSNLHLDHTSAAYPSPTITPGSAGGAGPAPGSVGGNTLDAFADHGQSFWTPIGSSLASSSQGLGGNSGVAGAGNVASDYTNSNSSRLVMQVKASSLSPHSISSAAVAASQASSYSSYTPHPSSYYHGMGVDLSYFGNHAAAAAANHQPHQYPNHYITNSTMLRSSSGLPSADYDAYNPTTDRYQNL